MRGGFFADPPIQKLLIAEEKKIAMDGKKSMHDDDAPCQGYRA
jgi:hypothetical protein